MLKKLTDEQQEKLLVTAVEEFGSKGPERAAVSEIARRSGISVGVIYKYYKNKEALFDACLTRSTDMLKAMIAEAADREDTLAEACEKLIRTCISFARRNPHYIQMYHAITHEPGEKAAYYAETIEKYTAMIYTGIIRKAQEEGTVRRDIDPAYLALFFDNLLMMLHFDAGCRYYNERRKFYLGAAEDDEKMTEQLVLFMKGAFGMADSVSSGSGPVAESTGSAQEGEV